MDTIVTPVTVITLDSTKITHNIKADLVARYFPPVVRLVQYDQSLPVIAVSLMQNGQTYTLPSGAAANIRVHKPDATYVYNPALGCDSTRNIVYFEVTQAMAAANGDGLAIVEIVVDGDIAGTSLITLHFEENPVPEDAIESSDEWETIYELGERIIASTVTPVSTAAGMTDHNVVYLYTGTETGWNQGHMYYYNGTTWVDAGIAVTDTTLSVSGLAADAKVTGDRFNSLDAGDIEYDDSETYSSGTVGDALSDLKDDLQAVQTEVAATLITDTASGAIASFPDGADGVPVKSLTVDAESGHTQAVVTRTGKNLFESSVLTEQAAWKHIELDLPEGTYTMSSTIPATGLDLAFYLVGGTQSGHFVYINHPTTLTITNGEKAQISFRRPSGSEIFSDYQYQIEVGSTASAFEPYNGQQYIIDLNGGSTETDITTIKGQNNIWADTGDVEVEYRADTKLYIEKLTAPTEDDMIADHAISANTFFMVGNTLYRATTAIASGATITVGTNATKLSLSDALNALS